MVATWFAPPASLEEHAPWDVPYLYRVLITRDKISSLLAQVLTCQARVIVEWMTDTETTGLDAWRARRDLPQPQMRRALRLAAGATQSEIASECGVDRASVSRWENGHRTPRGEHLVRYSAVLREFEEAAL